MTRRRRCPPGWRARHSVLAAVALLALAGSGLVGTGAGAVTTAGVLSHGTPRLVATPEAPGGTPSVVASPVAATAPATITLSGTGFDPLGGTVKCSFTSGTPATSSTLTLGHTGSVSGTLRLTPSDAVGLNPIECTQTSHTSTVLTAKVTFTVSAIASTCRVSTPAPTCVVDQVVGTTVTGTTLTMATLQNNTPNSASELNPTNLNVAFSQVTLGQKGITPECATPFFSPWPCGTSARVFSDGHLNTVVVDDNRGDLAGWTLTGQLTSTFEGPPAGSHHTIPASDLAWVPSVRANTISCVTLASVRSCGESDVVTEISAGPVQRLSTSESAVLCQALPGGGGGGTRCAAELYLDVPSDIIAGRYTATMEIVLS